jgi:hypothetical protein
MSEATDERRRNQMTTTTRMTAAAAAKLIRSEYALAGITARVRTEKWSTGSAIAIEVHTGSTRRANEIAGRFECVRRDSSGEVLGGGNRWVTVLPSDKRRKAALEVVRPMVADGTAAAYRGESFEVNGWTFRAIPGLRPAVAVGSEHFGVTERTFFVTGRQGQLDAETIAGMIVSTMLERI